MKMAKTITTRLPDEFVKNLWKIAKAENLDTSAVVRRLLAIAIKEWKKDYAVKQYTIGEFSFGQAAEFAEVSVWDFPSLLKEKKVPINYDEEELERDLRFVKKWKGKKQYQTRAL